MLEEKIQKNIKMYGDTKQERIACCKQFLEDTDYAIIKMYETVVQGGSILEMLKEYKEVLANRKEARQLINELENNKLGG